MRKQYYLPTRNPLAQVFATLAFVVVAAVAAVFGAFILATVIGLGAILTLIIAVRVWWLRRRLRRGGAEPGTNIGTTIEGEYRRYR
ncbi:hypothetical protein [Nitrococcus mobilis]|uniref:Uncharacterized protein n=1 Tax=Nitrococcus mobilis Nb-231 TaxID=314278 RepID=A4BSX2_9GAMM|nr:hypothetical protein [Nitrococcus mobilis]EAR21216.1 hypothetical protein NB231_00805 [Nitrococcus mobilis Nb-231]